MKKYLNKSFSTYSNQVGTFEINHINLKAESKKLKEQNQTEKLNTDDLVNNNSNSDYVHLHNNSQFSVLQSTTKISDLVKKTG